MLSIIAALAIGVQDKPALDRSAEAELKQLFVKAGSLRDIHIVVDSFSRAPGDWYTPGSTGDLYLGAAGHFRLESIATRGGPSLIVSDGITTMDDPLSDDAAIVLRKAAKHLYELAPQDCLAHVLSGEPGFNRLVDSAADIKYVPSAKGNKEIEFRSSVFGKVVFEMEENHDLPSRIDLYRSQRRRDEGAESTVPSTIQYIRVVKSGALPKWLFSVQPPKGKTVEDRRTIATGG